jgi:transposase
MEDMNMRGRKPSGPEYVERLEGSAKAKERAQVVLETLAGRLLIQEACSRLGVGEAFFNRLRRRFLTGGVPALEDRPAGRRQRVVSAEAQQLRKLEDELQQTRLELQAAQLREEIALTMPYLLQKPKGSRKKNAGGRGGDRRSGNDGGAGVGGSRGAE